MKIVAGLVSIGCMGLLVAGLAFAVNIGNASDLVSKEKSSDCACTTCCPDGTCCCSTSESKVAAAPDQLVN